MQAGMAVSDLFAGRFDTASSWAEKSFRHLPSFLMVVAIIAASHALAGQQDEAQGATGHFGELDLRSASPISGSGSPFADRRICDVRRWPATSRVIGMTTQCPLVTDT